MKAYEKAPSTKAKIYFTQIAVSQSATDDGGVSEQLVGLDNNGCVWEYRTGARRLPEGEQREVPYIAHNGQASTYKTGYAETESWWEPLSMSCVRPEWLKEGE